MNLSIIIPTYKRNEILKESVEAILRCYPNDDFECCIVNDDSGSVMEGIPVDPRIIVLQNEGKGAAAARNFGVSNTQRDNLLFLDDDIIITPGHFEKHLETIEQFENDIVTANRTERKDLVDLLMKTPFGRYKYKHDYIWHEGFDKEDIDGRYARITGAATFSCSMKRSVFNAVGRFDEAFPFAGSEDYDFFERAKKVDHKLIFDKSNWCYHNEPYNADMKTWMQRHYKGVASFILLCNKHTEIRETNRYSLYQQLKLSDNLKTILFKLKAVFLASKIGVLSINKLIKVGEKMKLNDRVMRRIYNAKFISVVRKGYKDFSYLEKQ